MRDKLTRRHFRTEKIFNIKLDAVFRFDHADHAVSVMYFAQSLSKKQKNTWWKQHKNRRIIHYIQRDAHIHTHNQILRRQRKDQIQQQQKTSMNIRNIKYRYLLWFPLVCVFLIFYCLHFFVMFVCLSLSLLPFSSIHLA